MFRFAGVVLNSCNAMQDRRDGFPPVTRSPVEPKKPRPPVGASSFFGLAGTLGRVRANRRSGESFRPRRIAASLAWQEPGKSEARLLGRASPVQAYDFPSRTRESKSIEVSRASVAIIGRLKGRLEAGGNKSASVAEKPQRGGVCRLPCPSPRGEGGALIQRAGWGAQNPHPSVASRSSSKAVAQSERAPPDLPKGEVSTRRQLLGIMLV
jgi:hypothetical protein